MRLCRGKEEVKEAGREISSRDKKSGLIVIKMIYFISLLMWLNSSHGFVFNYNLWLGLRKDCHVIPNMIGSK